MKAVRLTVKGFGPFIEEQEVDFQQLKDAALFLITGPTGSGKTTLLDAICFGLYGDTSGGGRDGRQMRSDFLQPSQVTEITFDFDIGPDSYRVRRTPVQVRPRRRGTGTTEEPATATLWRRTGVTDPNNDGEVIASQPTNVTDKVTELLGFECSQFRQVVLLPQGEFRKFLSATSREREQILEVLFQTETFRHIEEELKSTAKGIEEEIRTGRQRMDNFLEAAQAQSEDELRLRRDDAQQRLQELDGQLAVARGVEITAQQTYETARATAQKLTELDAAGTAFSTVKSREAGVESARQKLASARKAEQLLDLERSVRDRVQEHADAQAKCKDRQQERATAEHAETTARGRLATEEGRREEREAAGREVQRLSELRDRVEKIDLAATEVEAAETQDREETAECGRLDAKVRDLTQKVEQRDQQITALRASAQRADFLSLSEQRLDGLLQNRQRLDQVNAGLNSARSQFERASASLAKKNEDLKETRQHSDQLQSDWISAQAAILAANLVADGPCPVCGSTEHPAPARSEAPLPEEQELKRIQNKVRDLEVQAEALRRQAGLAQNEVTRHETEAGNLVTQLGETINAAVSQLTDELEDTRRDLGESRRAADEVARAVEEQERDRRDLAGVSAQLVAAKSRLQDASNRLAAARQALTERQAGVPESLRTQQSLEAAIQNASVRLEALTRAYEAARTQVEETSREAARCATAHDSAVTIEQTAAELARGAEAEFAGRLAQAGFGSPDDFSMAKAAISRVVQMEEEIRQFEADLSAAQSRLGRAQEGAAGLQPPDLQGIERDLTAAKEKVATLVREQHQLSESAKSMDRFLVQLNETREKLQSLETAHGVYGKIADVACGDNQLRITFQRFVQAALFEDVLQAASLRLRKMSKGRFELQRALRTADGRQSGGLDIVVLDSHTGTTRPVSSLSGGEGFMASLSLALGLADVVQNHAGGMRLESLFIDEGFGSLDAEALDQALQVLTDLHQGGRSIGIISHVTELKERISARIEVVPQVRGSIARIVGGIPTASMN
jgi:exonuclease SbcC